MSEIKSLPANSNILVILKLASDDFILRMGHIFLFLCTLNNLALIMNIVNDIM